jgi:hypothetical protein
MMSVRASALRVAHNVAQARARGARFTRSRVPSIPVMVGNARINNL